MKKLTVMTIVLALLLAVASVVCAATVEAEAGKEVEVVVDLEKTVTSGDYSVEYDSSKLTFKSATPNNDGGKNSARVIFYGQSTTTLTLTFDVAEGATGETEVKFVPSIFGLDGDEVEVEPQTITVKIGAEEVKTYTVKFVDYNGTVLKEEVVEEGKGATAPADPTREGYKFVGWDKEFAEVTGDLEVTAKYEKVEVKPGDQGTTTPPAEDEGKDDGEEENKGGEAGQKPTEPTKPSTSDDEMDPTGVSIAYVGLIALVVIAGAVVLIKRK